MTDDEWSRLRARGGCTDCFRFLVAIRFEWHADLDTMRALRRHWMQVHAALQAGGEDPFVVTVLDTFAERLWYRLCKCRTDDDRPARCQAFNRLGTYFHLVHSQGTEQCDRHQIGTSWYQCAIALPRACPVALNTLGWIFNYGLHETQPNRDVALSYYRQAADLGNPVAQYNLGISNSDDVMLCASAQTPLWFDSGAPPQWRHTVAGMEQEQGFSVAQWVLGRKFFDYQRIRVAAQQGYCKAQYSFVNRVLSQSTCSPSERLICSLVHWQGSLRRDAMTENNVRSHLHALFALVMRRLLLRAVWITRLLRISRSSPLHRSRRVMSLETFVMSILQPLCTCTCREVPDVCTQLPAAAVLAAARRADCAATTDSVRLLHECLPDVRERCVQFFTQRYMSIE